MSIMPKWMNWLPHQWYASTLLLPILILVYPSLRFGEAYELLLNKELSALDQFMPDWEQSSEWMRTLRGRALRTPC